MELSERKKQILRAVVEAYIETAEPVGSKAILELTGLKVSSATVRNELAGLEELGLLEQPHTSAGRIPSPSGYRVYVNELMEQHKLSIQETERINEALHGKMAQLDKVIDEAGKLVSRMIPLPCVYSGHRQGPHHHQALRPDHGGCQFLYRRGHDRQRRRAQQDHPAAL